MEIYTFHIYILKCINVSLLSKREADLGCKGKLPETTRPKEETLRGTRRKREPILPFDDGKLFIFYCILYSQKVLSVLTGIYEFMTNSSSCLARLKSTENYDLPLFIVSERSVGY